MAEIKKFNWGDSTNTEITVSADSFENSQALSISSDENLTIYDRTLSLQVQSESAGLTRTISVK